MAVTRKLSRISHQLLFPCTSRVWRLLLNLDKVFQKTSQKVSPNSIYFFSRRFSAPADSLLLTLNFSILFCSHTVLAHSGFILFLPAFFSPSILISSDLLHIFFIPPSRLALFLCLWALYAFERRQKWLPIVACTFACLKNECADIDAASRSRSCSVHPGLPKHWRM